jgi:hypothetical protein
MTRDEKILAYAGVAICMSIVIIMVGALLWFKP